MPFNIRMGIPEMEAFWNELSEKYANNTISKNELKLFKKLIKVLNFLSEDPRYNNLQTHEIEALSKRYGRKVWQSYLENNKPAAGRIFWVYGPEQEDITVIGIEPHPEDKKRGSYDRIALSDLP
jgi:hypothetical protein